MSNSSAVDEILNNAAKSAEAAEKPRKERKPKSEKAPAEPKPPKTPKEPKAPRMVPLVDDEGNPVLDEQGNQVMVEAPKKERKPKLDEHGNPIPRRSNVFLDSQVLKLTDKGLKTSYRPESKRGQIFASIKDGMTVGEFYALNGGKSNAHTFLVWYVNEAEVVDVE